MIALSRYICLNMLSPKKSILLFSAVMGLSIVFTLQSCKKKSRSDMGKALFATTNNKVFKDITPEGFSAVFQKKLIDQKARLTNPKIIVAYYEQHDYDPVLIMEHLDKQDLKVLPKYLQKSNEHGLDPKMFQTEKLKAMLAKLYDKNGIKTIDEAYQDMAELELTMANSLINYSNALQFGVMNPRRIYANYYTQTKRPDSISMSHVFEVKSFKTFLDSIQPKDPQYLALQKALVGTTAAPGMSAEETQRAILVNLERLRWKNKPSESKYVLVNIPDYQLNFMDNGKSILNMKVCVGEGRNKDHSHNLVEYDDSYQIDRPFSRETPQLNSMIYVAEVNPVWNIPQSIASKEIIVEAAKDPYYLSNKNIVVYKGGQEVEDPETIKWATLSENEKASYSFKQKPGDDNSLGKIKFLFKNSTNVYLTILRPSRHLLNRCGR